MRGWCSDFIIWADKDKDIKIHSRTNETFNKKLPVKYCAKSKKDESDWRHPGVHRSESNNVKAAAGGTGEIQGDTEERTASSTTGGQDRFCRRGARKNEQVCANEEKMILEQGNRLIKDTEAFGTITHKP